MPKRPLPRLPGWKPVTAKVELMVAFAKRGLRRAEAEAA